MNIGMYGWTLYFTLKKEQSASAPSEFLTRLPRCIGAYIMLGSPSKKAPSGFNAGSSKGYIKPVVRSEDTHAEGSRIQPRKAFKPVLDFNDKGETLSSDRVGLV